ncbi:serine/threonine protein kinase, partial [Myxococcus xanthus]|nr:serine/threonine protein kinase [Myxococcus xanthus]
PPPRPVAPASRAPAPAEKPADKQPPWKLLGIAGGGALVLAVVAVVMMRDGGSNFVNVGPGEHVYVGGLRHEPGTEVHDPSGGPLLISTAVDGKLRRFGTTQQREGIDVRTLADASQEPGTTGLLSVTGAAPGCEVHVGGALLPGGTPLLKARIEAGRELEVLVRCPSGVSKLWVMAVPGQQIEVKSQPRN